MIFRAWLDDQVDVGCWPPNQVTLKNLFRPSENYDIIVDVGNKRRCTIKNKKHGIAITGCGFGVGSNWISLPTQGLARFRALVSYHGFVRAHSGSWFIRNFKAGAYQN